MQGQTSAYVLPSLITAPATGDLALLANVKDELDITDSTVDARLRRLISEESANIARYCNRIFGRAIWLDAFRPQKGVWGEGVRAANNPLMLLRYPILGQPVAFTGTTAVNNQTVSGLSSTQGLCAGQPVFGPGITPGTLIEAVVTNGVILTRPATAAGIAVQLSANLAICEMIAGTAKWLIAGTDFEVEVPSRLPGDEGSGLIYRLNWLKQPRAWSPALTQVWYQAGYTLPDNAAKTAPPYDLPLDLETACIRILVGRYAKRTRDPLLVERTQPGTLGMQRWWVGAIPGNSGPWTEDIQSTIDRYRTPVMASA